ncbi:MAG: hypothetical protein LAO78_11110 [Acidobacteriia bacterium]|nr:hypothetical protein [Terriglobia bacterium]
MNLRVKFVLSIVFLGLLCLMLSGSIYADTVNINSINANSTPFFVDITTTNLLAQYGITLANVTPGTTVAVVCGQCGGNSIVSSTPPNVLAQSGNDNGMSYTLQFSTPLSTLSFSLAGNSKSGGSGTLVAAWSATAFDASGNVVSSAGDPSLFGTFSPFAPQPFTLTGPGIASVTFFTQCFNVCGTGLNIADLSAPEIKLKSPTCQSATAAMGHNWSLNYATCGNDGLILTDVKLGSRLLARRMSLPYYTLLDSNGAILARCELEVAAASGTPCGSQLRNGSVFVGDSGTALVVSATYDIAALPGLPGASLSITQNYQFGEEGTLVLCEPSGLLSPCAHFQPIVSYQFIPPPGQNFAGGINTVQRLELDIDGAGTNASAFFQDLIVPRKIHHIIPPEFSVVDAPQGNPIPQEVGPISAIQSGNAGVVDNLHQTSLAQVSEPGFKKFQGHYTLAAPGCPECGHIHWRWGSAVRFVDANFFAANGAGNPIIPAGSNQDVQVAVTLARPGEEHPQDYTSLINGESLLGGTPVFWYSALGHQAADTFFMHGGFFVSQP